MEKKYSTSLDYRKLADELWEKARVQELAGLYDLANYLKGMADQMHDVARKKAEEESFIKNCN